jgi:integrase
VPGTVGVSNPIGTAAQVTVAQYLEEWLAFAETRVRRSTLETYQSHLRVHVMPQLGNRRLDEIRALELQRLYSELLHTRQSRGTSALSPRTVVHIHRVLSEALRQAVRWGLLGTNPADGASPPRPRPTQTTIVDVSAAEYILRASKGTELGLPVALALGTGMRRGEILGLCWDDMDLESGILRVSRTLHITRVGLLLEEPKTRQSRRAIVLPRFLAETLAHERAAKATIPVEIAGRSVNLVVRTRKNQAWNPDSMSSSWRRFARRIGLPSVRFHDLRHAHATLMLVQGIHPKIVSERLGHSNVGITLDTYSHVLPSMQVQAAEALDELLRGAPSGGASGYS